MKTVHNLGSLNIDQVCRVPYLVRAGETLSAKSYSEGPGGKGFNQSIALARAGAPVRHLVHCGVGAEPLRALLDKDGIDTRSMPVCDQSAGRALIQVDDHGENAIVLFPGSNHAVTPADISSWLSATQPGDWFLTQNETTCVREALTAAHAAGLTVCWNPAPITPGLADYPLELLHWLVVNETEGRELSGHEDPAAILSALRVRAPHAHIVLTLGAQGALCLTPSGETLSVTPPPTKPIDTTAAGDTFIGFLLASILRGDTVSSALDTACRAAALSTTRPGAAESIPHLRDLAS